MTQHSGPFTRKPLTPTQALLFGTLAVGGLDILDAIVFFGFRGVSPIRILQSIASGLMGASAYSGGLATALLGGVLHFFIAFCIVAVYYGASRKLPTLARHPLRYGPLYGLVVYGIMTLIVVPLSAASTGEPALAVLINGVGIHILGVGVPSALCAWRVPRSRRAASSSGFHAG